MTPSKDFELVYQDDCLLVAAKPAGLLAVPGRGVDKQDCLSVRLQSQFPDALTVHRLDMATSGLMVFARGAEMQRSLSCMFRERQVKKYYVALVAGKPEPESGEINLPLAADWPNRPMQKVDGPRGKPSLTRYRVSESFVSICPKFFEQCKFNPGAGCGPGSNLSPQGPDPICSGLRGRCSNGSFPVSRVELEPVTGRTHQLRVHMAAIGHPMLGDALYGDAQGVPRLMLHATRLGLLHPLTGAPLHFVSPPPF